MFRYYADKDAFDKKIATCNQALAIAKGFKGGKPPPSPLVNKWLEDAINASIIQNHVPDDRAMRMKLTLEGADKSPQAGEE